MTEQKDLIGFLGLGAMGGGSASCLLKAGYPLIAYDPLVDRLDSHVRAGGRAAADEGEVVDSAGIVFISMPFADILERLMAETIVPRLRPGQIIVDIGTTPVAQTHAYARTLAAAGAQWVDAPVSGGPEGAAKGQLRVFAGGDPAACGTLRPLLETIGDPQYVVYCGPSGAGQVVKAVNQLVMGLVTASCLEALSMGVRSGVPAGVLLAAVGGAGGCRAEFAAAARRVVEGDGEQVHIKYGQYEEFLGHTRCENIPMPITEALTAFCAAGEPRVYELARHERLGRKAPSFWHELQTRGSEAAP